MWACGQIYSDYKYIEHRSMGKKKEKCEILAQKKYKSTPATNPTTFSLHIVHFHCTLYIFIAHCCIEEWNWKEEMRNIGPKEIQVNNRNKSNWTLSLQKGGQIGGWRSGGPSAIMCDENFHQIGTHLFPTHIRFQLYPILPVPKLFWPWKWASKLKSHFLRGSFSRLTFKSGGDPV